MGTVKFYAGKMPTDADQSPAGTLLATIQVNEMPLKMTPAIADKLLAPQENSMDPIIENELISLGYQRYLIENMTLELDELWLINEDKIEYLEWLQGILTLCRTGK